MSLAVINEQNLHDIADAIRIKNGTENTYTPGQMASAIENIPTGENKLPGVVDGSVTTITAEDLVDATKIKDYAFDNCINLISVVIPDSVTSIGRNAFNGCSSLTSTIIGNGVTNIGDEAFHNCTSLTSIIIGNSVTNIGSMAFWDCDSLKSITLPNSVTSIGQFAFYDCSLFTTMTILATTPPTLPDTSSLGGKIQTIYIPHGTLSAYQTAKNWSSFSNKFVELPA